MKIKTLLSLLLINAFQFVSCKTDTDDKRIAFDAKVTLEEAVTIPDTPMMLGVSVYAHLVHKSKLSSFSKAFSKRLKELLMATAGPYTVFAPTNAALVVSKSDNFNDVILEKHIVKGVLTSSSLVKLIREHGGRYVFLSIAGEELKATRHGMEIVIEDTKGNLATLQQTDFLAENGVVHIINKILE